MTSSSLQFGAEHGDDVVGRNHANEFVVFVDYGKSDEIVFVEKFGDFIVVGAFRDGEEWLLRKRKKRSAGLGDDELHEGNGAGESAMRINEVDSADRLDAAFEPAHHPNGILDRGRDGKREELGCHAASGGFFPVFEEFDDFLAGFGFHLDQDLFGVILREVSKKVGGRIGIHFLYDVGSALGVERFDDGPLDPGVNFLESLGGNIFIEGSEDGFAFVRRKVFHDVGDVGGMQLGQAFVRDPELNPACGIRFDEVDKAPGNGARRNFFQQNMKGTPGREAAQKAAQGSTGADIDGLYPQDSAILPCFTYDIDLQIDIVDTDYLSSVNVDDLLVKEVSFKKKLAFGAVGGEPVRRSGGGVNAGVDSRNSGEGKDAVTGFGFNDERGDAVSIFLRSDSNFAHLSPSRTRRVIDGGAQKLGKRQRGHPG